MDYEHAQKIDGVARGALELDAAERAAFLDSACGGDESLRREVEAFVASRRPSWEAAEAEDRVPEITATAQPGPGREPDDRQDAEGRRCIGPYRLLRPIGHGGMGTVYLAARDDDEYRRRVAVKLIQPGLHSAAVARRFRTERQILANLDHPHIAGLFEGGTTPDGRPYFVMEYIDGTPIDRYCDERRLDLGARLELVREVCAAVQYAHQSLVVHRDIKPSNILVTPAGVPKLLDFGIAKLLKPQDSPHAVEATRTGLRPMTPSYASPEQIRGRAITTASDVYSLGVLLYQLLTGRLPFRLAGLSPRQIERVLTESEPPKPSTAVTGSGEPDGGVTPESVSWHRATQPQKLRRQLSGDLDNIVQMALRREPERRYGSAGQLSEDLRRYLQGLPVAARDDTLAYRIGKFLRRNRLAVALAALVLVLVLGFAVAMAWQAEQTSRQRDQAERERDRTDEVLSFLVDLFEVADPGETRGNSITAREILDAGAEQIRGLRDQPEVRAALSDAVGRVYRNLGLYDQAEPLLQGALATRESLDAGSAEVADSLNELATLHQLRGDYERAEPLFQRALRLAEQRLGPEHPQVGVALENLALLYHEKTGDLERAEPLYRRALSIQEQALGPEHPEVASILANLGNVYFARGDYRRSAALHRRALEILEKRLGADYPDLAFDLYALAVIEYYNGDYERAETLTRRALAVWEKALGPEHPNLALAFDHFGNIASARGDYERAEEDFRRALSLREQALGPDHPRIAQSLNGLARIYLARGENERAEPLLRRAVAICEKSMGTEHYFTAFSYQNLGSLHRARGDFARAETLFRQVLETRRKALGEDHPAVADTLKLLASVSAKTGRYNEAEALYERALAILEGFLARVPDSRLERWRRASILLGLGDLHRRRGELRQAEAAWEEAAVVMEPLLEGSEAMDFLLTRAEALLRLGRVEEARPAVERLWASGRRSGEFLALCRDHGLVPGEKAG